MNTVVALKAAEKKILIDLAGIKPMLVDSIDPKFGGLPTGPLGKSLKPGEYMYFYTHPPSMYDTNTSPPDQCW